MESLSLHAEVERWPLAAPFRITGYVFEAIDVLLVRLQSQGHVGRGEAAGIYYKSDRPASMLQTIESVRAAIERGITRATLQELLPAGGARNAVDCALWDLESKISGQPAWQLAALERPRALVTTFGCGADTPQSMAATARTYADARAIKLKLTGEPVDEDRIRAVREALPDVWLGVDANQGFTRPFLEQLMPALVELKVALIEQPFAVGQEALLDGFRSPIPIAADESIMDAADLPKLVGRFSTVNIKLDKCGGLSEALLMARKARSMGFETMVGNMIGTSLAMAPAFLVGQLCSVVDLDGPLFLKSDRAPCVRYSDGLLSCDETVWGGSTNPPDT
jgi:L-alanine-DL-glutamate epimerase-like enolase superfamily enzyme